MRLTPPKRLAASRYDSYGDDGVMTACVRTGKYCFMIRFVRIGSKRSYGYRTGIFFSAARASDAAHDVCCRA